MSNGELHFVECFAWPRGLFFISHHIVHICLPSFLLVTNNSGEQFPASGCNLQRPFQIIPHPSHLLHHQFGGRRSHNRFGCGPFFAAYYFACYCYQTLLPGKVFDYLFQTGTFVSLVMLSTSFLLVLALTTTQYIAITFPHKYRRFFTKKRVLVSVSCCFVYFSIFSSLQFTKFPEEIYFKINLHLHPTVVGVLLTAAHIFLYKSFRKFVRKSKAIRQQNMINQSINQPSHDNKSEAKHQKQLTVVALFLSALLLLSLFPHIVTFYVFLYTRHQSYEFRFRVSIALRVSDMIMFLKVALDAYIYAWRHPKYRKAVKDAILCHIMQAARERETEQELIATG